MHSIRASIPLDPCWYSIDVSEPTIRPAKPNQFRCRPGSILPFFEASSIGSISRLSSAFLYSHPFYSWLHPHDSLISFASSSIFPGWRRYCHHWLRVQSSSTQKTTAARSPRGAHSRDPARIYPIRRGLTPRLWIRLVARDALLPHHSIPATEKAKGTKRVHFQLSGRLAAHHRLEAQPLSPTVRRESTEHRCFQSHPEAPGNTIRVPLRQQPQSSKTKGLERAEESRPWEPEMPGPFHTPAGRQLANSGEISHEQKLFLADRGRETEQTP